MLKITLHDSAERVSPSPGRQTLAALGSAELRQCWETASSTTAGPEDRPGSSGRGFRGPAGEVLLADMHRRDVELVAVTPLIRTVVEELRPRL